MTMRHTPSILLAGGVLATVVLLGWILVTLFLPWFAEVPDISEHGGAQVELFDTAQPDVCGIVKSVDAAHGRITLGFSIEDAKEQEQVYDLASGVKVLLDGPATLDELAIGTPVGLEFGADGKDVVAIRSEPLRIAVESKQNEVEVGKPFNVVLRVTNASPAPQCFWVMCNTWYIHWRSTNPRVTWDAWCCYHNFPESIKLAPGEAYEKILPMKVTAAGGVSFKMGFTALADDRFGVPEEHTNGDGEVKMKINLSKRTYWSREVALKANPCSAK
jgi:hypothetical protein